jgi:hypothetical protein
MVAVPTEQDFLLNQVKTHFLYNTSIPVGKSASIHSTPHQPGEPLLRFTVTRGTERPLGLIFLQARGDGTYAISSMASNRPLAPVNIPQTLMSPDMGTVLRVMTRHAETMEKIL